ncbi:UDP-N-acetylglucosamine 2-epimerase (non-hydrolyzing) [Haemophilus paracuniculus]|uniref:UDP-N-acetylglucosamine 2-epimerase n=1 Tax=Haemophilus paracuniculus TaxID=734 RepID=A0A1T0ATJ0_9PAST|nr:UDP-N-acetylglucosamine 2-epimerase (non-hydrolyzing) [Haemophilus paracuniculus]OOR99926.1 UDP-N-acetylglucosamine 2-epimerase (non-hydrolyzing) [Haemophilus paracuniculus]
MANRNILIVFGTRPEAIKLAPLAKLLAKQTACNVKICVTGQHRQMLDQVLDLFEITPDFDLNIMANGQSLADITAKVLQKLPPIFEAFRPDLVIVHGDTTTSFSAALASFYAKILIAHVEAGLRTHNLKSPFPEEGNRALTGVLADYHFAPTLSAQANLLREGKSAERIWVTGNTVIDALFEVRQKIQQNPPLATALAARYPFLNPDQKMILVTAHRREHFGEGFERICQALATLAEQHPTVQIVYPVHLNPKVQEPVHRWLTKFENIFLIEPQDYLPFVYLMDQAYLILTDSGGIQEEAPALGKPVLVMRESTERFEAVEAGTVKLVGTDPTKICQETTALLTNPTAYQQMAQAHNPYGNGDACQRIVDILNQQLQGDR